MKQNNEEGRYDQALKKNKSLLKYFLTEVPERTQVLERVETAAEAA